MLLPKPCSHFLYGTFPLSRSKLITDYTLNNMAVSDRNPSARYKRKAERQFQSLRTPLPKLQGFPAIKRWSWGESNPLPLECHSSALPSELQPRKHGLHPSGKSLRVNTNEAGLRGWPSGWGGIFLWWGIFGSSLHCFLKNSVTLVDAVQDIFADQAAALYREMYAVPVAQ